MRLTVLDEVTWDGVAIPGERTHALLRALVGAAGRPVSDGRLVDEVWGIDEVPANPAKALQVVVSRARSATSAGAIVRTPGGYRLDLAAEDVDAWAARPLGLRLAAEGQYDDALPLLLRADPDDEVVAALLRAVAAVHGVPAALDRYEQYRQELADRLGVDPSPALQALHRELLARDQPVRTGIHHYASSLVGREDDRHALRRLLREHRVVSILGPGGLGKTRLAQLVAADAEQPTVHVVELVGIVSPDDVVAEVGSVLGVRDSIAGRRVLTPDQRRDVRAQVAEHLDRAPTLLVLDNCEHLVDAVADLVAFLVAAAPRLRVLTTTRAPLAISAERVLALAQLEPDDAVDLFRQRATAARPGVDLPEETVREVVARLDGLPLAIELAAVKVRVMSVAEVAHRLADRFQLLRGGDRSAPDRHQTLLAVIDWSWNLLAERDRRALRRLSLFQDGFSLGAAEAMLGPEALDALQDLADQSLLTVGESGGATRYRMLETVREFGRMRLADAGEEGLARADQRAWGIGYVDRHGPHLYDADQAAAMDALRAEEANLADLLRQALADGDPAETVQLFAALGGFWTIAGEHGRVLALVGAAASVLADWTPPPALVERTRMVAGLLLFGTALGLDDEAALMRGLVERIGVDSPSPQLRALLTIMQALADPSGDTIRARLEDLLHDSDRSARAIAHMFLSHERENSGDPDGAIEAARRALDLVGQEEPPWTAASLHTQLAGLYGQVGDLAASALHAAEALPVLVRLGATDDVLQLQAFCALAAIEAGRVDEAEALVSGIDDQATGGLGSRGAVLAARAELALARGDTAGALARYRASADAMRALRMPGVTTDGALMPWVVVGEGAALAAYTRLGEGDDGADLYAALVAKAEASTSATRPLLDYPVAGVLLFATGLWGLLRAQLPTRDAVRLLVLARRFAYSQVSAHMRWDPAAADARRIAPGVLEEIEAEYGDRRGPDLLEEARALLTRLYG